MKARSGKYLAVHLRGVKPARTGAVHGAKVILKALEAPLYYIAANAGLEGAVIINKVKES